jgi:hypothetical protein
LVVQNVNAPAVQLALTVSSPEARTHEDSKDKHTKHAFEIDADKFRVLLTGPTPTLIFINLLYYYIIFTYILFEIRDCTTLLSLTRYCSVSCPELQIARAMMEAIPTGDEGRE